MAETPNKITCEACGRNGPWRPEFAGRQIKCKCGHLIKVPQINTPVAAVAAEPDDLYGIQEDEPDPKKLPKLAPLAPPVDPSTAEPAVKRMGKFSPPKQDHSDAQKAEEKSKLIKLAIIVGVAILLVGGAIVGMKLLSKPAKVYVGEDAEIQEKLDDEPNKEIHEWIAQDSNRMAGPWSSKQVIYRADEWQKMGAKKVIAFGSRMSNILVMELPTDPAQRKSLFDWQADWHKQHNFRIRTDVGQKYLMIELGL